MPLTPSPSKVFASGRSIRTIAPLVLLAFLALTFAGCATRISRTKIINRLDVEVSLVREVKGFSTQPRNFQHPAIVSKERLRNILYAIEVDAPGEKGSTIRQPAIHADLLDQAAASLREALAEATPNDEIAVNLVRKEAKLGLFHTKYLTNFLASIKDDHLYLTFSRVEWPIPQSKEKDKLPQPRHDTAPMNIRVVSGDPLFFAGTRTLEIAWQDNVFRKPFRLPGSAGGEKRRRQVLFQSTVPKDELEKDASGGPGLADLSPDQLRALADLEEDRRGGQITEAAYQRAKRQLLRKR